MILKPELVSRIYVLPILLLLPTSITVLVMEKRLVDAAGGGYYSPEAVDVIIRWGMSGGLAPFLLLTILGTVIWLVAFVMWVRLIWQNRKMHWQKLLLLLIGSISHIWVMGFISDTMRKMIP